MLVRLSQLSRLRREGVGETHQRRVQSAKGEVERIFREGGIRGEGADAGAEDAAGDGVKNAAHGAADGGAALGSGIMSDAVDDGSAAGEQRAGGQDELHGVPFSGQFGQG